MTIIEKNQLTAYTLKLNDGERQRLKMICALGKSLKYQYEFFYAAVNWALSDSASLRPIANSKPGGNRSYYLRDTTDGVKSFHRNGIATLRGRFTHN